MPARFRASQRTMTSIAIATFLSLALAAGPCLAQSPPRRIGPAEGLGFGLQDVGRYERCLTRARSAPQEAFDEAKSWSARGGGDAARHCAALALLHGGEPALAAEQLEQLANAMEKRPAALRAEILAQASHAWLAVDDLPRARMAATAALRLDGRNPEIWIDRAEALAAAGAYWEAIDDLNRALELDPRRAEALAFRAAAYRHVDAKDLAREDVDRALALNPRLPEAWLERGILDRLAGDAAGARRAWLQVLVLDADGPAGDAARESIAALEHKLDPAGAERTRPARR
ncbi:MAG: hypothetical protein JNK67_15010 [Alphaproteobacteria bacterium]|nr:hypothetical protein [Alphaproteobacteria bacterium]